jgi:hypothetical protein
MVKRLLLPNRPLVMKKLVDAMGCSTLEALHDLRQTKGPAILVFQRREKQMNMVGHDHGSNQIDSSSMFPPTVLHHQVASLCRQDQGTTSPKGEEKRGVWFLQMREPTAVRIPGERS